MPAGPTSILFLCTGNSCRSQMAEGWVNHLHGDRIRACSAGVEQHGLNPLAVRVMAEAGVDISGHSSKRIEQLPLQEFDYIITVCDHARSGCPMFTGPGKVLHREFADPPRLAAQLRDMEEQLAVYRKVRDEIRDFVITLPGWLESSQRFQRAQKKGSPG